jgi:hypothetical protein
MGAAVRALIDDTIKGVLRSLGDAGASPSNTTGQTLLYLLNRQFPIAKAAVFNTALPTAEASLLGDDITPTNSPSILRIYVCISVAGVLRVARTVGATTVTEDLNGGTALAAGAGYMFDVEWRSGDSVNFRYSVTTGTINVLRADEVGA